MTIKGDLAGIIGSKYVSDQPETLEKYSAGNVKGGELRCRWEMKNIS